MYYNNIFEDEIKAKIEYIMQGAYDNLHNMASYPQEIAAIITAKLLEYACLGQNYVPIEIARRKIGEIEKDWLNKNIIAIGIKSINLDDEWEFRRFVELLIMVAPEQFPVVLDLAKVSPNPEIREICDDFTDVCCRSSLCP